MALFTIRFIHIKDPRTLIRKIDIPTTHSKAMFGAFSLIHKRAEEACGLGDSCWRLNDVASDESIVESICSCEFSTTASGQKK